MSDNLFIAKKDMNLYGDYEVNIGEVIERKGSVNDAKIFGDDTHWVRRFEERAGEEPIICGTDGCTRRFENLGMLDRHRQRVHAPEREDRLRFQREAVETRMARESRGETLGGYEVTRTVDTGKGKVPYVKIK